MTKKDREELAIKKRQEEVEAKRKEMEEQRQKRQQFMVEAQSETDIDLFFTLESLKVAKGASDQERLLKLRVKSFSTF